MEKTNMYPKDTYQCIIDINFVLKIVLLFI
jgi:hypothetical protein